MSLAHMRIHINALSGQMVLQSVVYVFKSGTAVSTHLQKERYRQLSIDYITVHVAHLRTANKPGSLHKTCAHTSLTLS